MSAIEDEHLLGVGQALRRLRGAGSVQALFASATRALCEHAGFDSATVFALDGASLVPKSVFPEPDEPVEPLDLEPGTRIAEVLRRRRAVLVVGAAESFVAAPIVCSEQCVGLIHADAGDAAVTDVDRDTLAVFAEGFGHALERCVLAGRLHAHAERVLMLVRSTEASVSELGRCEFAPGAVSGAVGWPPPAVNGHGANGNGHGANGNGHGANGNGLELLTRRELEVVAMLAEGETNARIARRLVVSEDTVKSHVKHILRKLGVHNRSQAVSRYFQAGAAR